MGAGASLVSLLQKELYPGAEVKLRWPHSSGNATPRRPGANELSNRCPEELRCGCFNATESERLTCRRRLLSISSGDLATGIYSAGLHPRILGTQEVNVPPY